MAADWVPDQYHDTYRKLVEELIDQKRQGAVVTTERHEPALPPVVDLMEALRERRGSRRPQGIRGFAEFAVAESRQERCRRRIGSRIGDGGAGSSEQRRQAAEVRHTWTSSGFCLRTVEVRALRQGD